MLYCLLTKMLIHSVIIFLPCDVDETAILVTQNSDTEDTATKYCTLKISSTKRTVCLVTLSFCSL